MTTPATIGPCPGCPARPGNGQCAAQPGTPPEPDVAAWIASASLAQVTAAYRTVSALFAYRDLLSASLLVGLRELSDRLSERLCPYSTRELDAARDRLNRDFPDYDHWYIRSGTAVTWCDRRKNKPTA